jgi:hypothetical protein
VRVHPRQRRLAALALGLLSTVAAVAADPPQSPRAKEAMDLCARGRASAVKADQRALLARGLAVAEEAIAADERDAWAHFAVFCNLGKQTELAGVGIGSLMALRRLRREIDRTIELAPTFPDALLGKGEFLLSVPRILGGSPKEGEEFIRRALAVDPDYLGARLALTRALIDRGARAEAREEAERARVLCDQEGDDGDRAELRKIQEKLGG